MGIALSEADQADAADRMEKWLEARFGSIARFFEHITTPLDENRGAFSADQTKYYHVVRWSGTCAAGRLTARQCPFLPPA